MDCLTWAIGDITIIQLVESAGVGPMGGPDSFLTEATPDVLKTIDWLIPDFVNEDGHARFSLHALLIQTPGHKLGHVSVAFESRGECAIIAGDMMHHPCQVARPEWAAAFDSGSGESMATRRAFFRASTRTMVTSFCNAKLKTSIA